MRPKRWIPVEDDRNVSHGDLRIVKLADGTVRATKWRSYDAWSDARGCYGDRHGDGVDSPRNPVAAVGVTWERKRSGPSGPSGKNLVVKRSVRVPDERWDRFGAAVTAQGRDRNGVLNDLIDEYCARSR